MKVSGHKTANVFKRHDIVEQADLREAAAQAGACAYVVKENLLSLLPLLGS